MKDSRKQDHLVQKLLTARLRALLQVAERSRFTRARPRCNSKAVVSGESSAIEPMGELESSLWLGCGCAVIGKPAQVN